MSARLELDELVAQSNDADNDNGYIVEIEFQGRVASVDPSDEFDSRHATLNAIDKLLEPIGFQIRYAIASNGADTLGIVVERLDDWDTLYRLHGRKVNQWFCPIRELPDLLNSNENEIDQACSEYADRVG